MNFNLNAQIGGRFKLVARKVNTDEISQETGWFENLVLDQGLDLMATESWFIGISVGTGNSIPTAAQTQLDNYHAETTSAQGSGVNGAAPEAPYFAFSRRTFRFAAGVFNNTILSEVGICTNKRVGSKYLIWNRALIKDSNGSPTTLTLLADEYLDVMAEVRSYYPAADKIGSFQIKDKNGAVISTINTIARPASITTSRSLGAPAAQYIANNYVRGFSGDIGEKTNVPTGNSSLGAAYEVTVVTIPYVAGSREIKGKYTTPLNIGNTHSTKSLLINTAFGDFQIGFDVPIKKTSEQVLILEYSVTWGRYVA